MLLYSGEYDVMIPIPLSEVDEKTGANSSPMELWGPIWDARKRLYLVTILKKLYQILKYDIFC